MNKHPGVVNYQWAYQFAHTAYTLGIRHVCISPGSRSTPLTLAFTNYQGFRLYSHIDERSCGYFALGISKVTQQPTIVISTSGTAAANLFPAIIEAYYSNVPFMICTADRPPELQNTGANQTIDQQNLYGNKVHLYQDMGIPEDSKEKYNQLFHFTIEGYQASLDIPPGPVHLNFPFRKPLEPNPERNIETLQPLLSEIDISHIYSDKYIDFDDDFSVQKIAENSKRGIIFIGPMEFNPGVSEAIITLAEHLNFPVFSDGLSQIRFGASDHSTVCHYAANYLDSPLFTGELRPDLILRFGNMPTSKAGIEFLRNNTEVTQILINESGVKTDSTHSLDRHITAQIIPFCQRINEKFESPHNKSRQNYLEAVKKVDAIAQTYIHEDSTGEREIHLFRELIPLLEKPVNLMVSNSMPVRDLDAFAPPSSRQIPLYFNRGASGIDGIISTAFGVAAASGQPTVLITGDLAFYHDMNGLLAWKRYQIPLTIILVNNNGGSIFEMLPVSALKSKGFSEFFVTQHHLNFATFIKGYEGQYYQPETWEEFRRAVTSSVHTDNLSIIELRTDGTSATVARTQLRNNITNAITASFSDAN